MKSWQWKLVGAAMVIWITAATVVIALTLSYTVTGERHIESVQQSNTENNNFVDNGVKALTPFLVYIGQAFTAVCEAEPHCVIPPYPPKGTKP